MPVLIDNIDTEIEFGPSQPAGEPARPAMHAPATPTMAAAHDAHRRAVLAVLEAELDQYMRMRG